MDVQTLDIGAALRGEGEDCDDEGTPEDWWCGSTLVAIASALLVVAIVWAFLLWWNFQAIQLSLCGQMKNNGEYQVWRLFFSVLLFAIAMLFPRRTLFDNGCFTGLLLVSFFVYGLISYVCLPEYVYAFRVEAKAACNVGVLVEDAAKLREQGRTAQFLF